MNNNNNNNNNSHNHNHNNDYNNIDNYCDSRSNQENPYDITKYYAKKNSIFQMMRSLPVSVHTYVLESHILSTKMGLDSKLNFIIRFTSDIGDSLLVLIKRQNDQKKIDENLESDSKGQRHTKEMRNANYVNMMVELRCTLLYLIYLKYEMELLLCNECDCRDWQRKERRVKVENGGGESRRGSERSGKGEEKGKQGEEEGGEVGEDTESRTHSRQLKNETSFDDVTDGQEKYSKMKIDLLEQLRCQCKVILFEMEPLGHLVTLPVWTVYLAIETMIAQSTNDWNNSEEEGTMVEGGKKENKNDNKMDEDKGRNKGRDTSEEMGDIREIKRKFVSKYSVSQNISHNLLSLLCDEGMTMESVMSDVNISSHNTNLTDRERDRREGKQYDTNLLPLYSLIVYQVCLKLPLSLSIFVSHLAVPIPQISSSTPHSIKSRAHDLKTDNYLKIHKVNSKDSKRFNNHEMGFGTRTFDSAIMLAGVEKAISVIFCLTGSKEEKKEEKGNGKGKKYNAICITAK